MTTGYQHLNAAQQRAVKQALGSELTYVWGPPGTGKTDVVARIVEGYVRLGRRVLFVAPTNVAVDQALERICDLLSPAPAFQEGLVQRLGDIHVSSLRDSYGDSIDRDRLLGKHTEELDHQAQRLWDEQARITESLTARKHIDDLERKLQNKRQQRSAYEQRLQPALAELERTKTVIADLQQQIAEANNHSALRRRLTASKKERWEGDLALNADNLTQLQRACGGGQSSLDTLDRQINDVLAELRRAGAEQIPSRTRLEQQATEANQALKDIEAQRQRLEHDLTQACHNLREHVVMPLLDRGYRVAVSLTPTAGRWLSESGEVDKLESVTGLPVRWTSRLPTEPKPHQQPTATPSFPPPPPRQAGARHRRQPSPHPRLRSHRRPRHPRHRLPQGHRSTRRPPSLGHPPREPP